MTYACFCFREETPLRLRRVFLHRRDGVLRRRRLPPFAGELDVQWIR